MNSIFENWRNNTLDEAREDDLRKKYGPRFFVLKRFTGASELMEDMIKWVNATDYGEFKRREVMFAKQRREGDISTEEYMQRVNDLRGDNRPTYRKARLKYLDWMIKQVDLFVNHMNIPDAEGNHSTLQRLERLADKESAELTGNAIRRYVPDYVKNPGPNIKAYENAVKMISTFRNGLKASVADFDKNKNAMKEKDINRYKYLHTLRQSLKREVREPRIDKSIAGFEGRVREGEAKFFRLPRPFTMVRPLSTKASCAYGSGKWCIAQKGNAHFDDYTDDGLVFYNVQDHSRRKEDKFSILAFQVEAHRDWDDRFVDWTIEGFWDYPNRWHTKLDRLRTEYGDDIVDQIVKIINEDMKNFSATSRSEEEKNADTEPGAPRQVDWDDGDDYDVQDDENVNERVDLGKYVWPSANPMYQKDLDIFGEPDTEIERKLYLQLHKHFSTTSYWVKNNEPPIDDESVKALRSILTSGEYANEFKSCANPQATMLRGMHVSLDWVRQNAPGALEAMAEDTDILEYNKPFPVEFTYRSKGKYGGVSSWTPNERVARAFAATRNKGGEVSCILYAKCDSGVFMSTAPFAVYKGGEYKKDHEIKKLNPASKESEFLLFGECQVVAIQLRGPKKSNPVRENKKAKLSIKVKIAEKKKKKKAGTESSKESSLHHWFKRKGAKGKKSGWVDCNSPDGKGGYKSCGREEGEKRKKYPACRPTPGACKERGRGKSWGKKGKKK